MKHSFFHPSFITVLLLSLSLHASAHRACGAGEACGAEVSRVRASVVCSQFLFDSAPFPSCHAATIEALPSGDLLAAFFGGAHEGSNDVCIWLCRKPQGDDSWSAPERVAQGEVADGVQHPCWNPVLFRLPGSESELLLFYKTGIFIKDWVGHLMRSSDGGHTWGKPEPLGRFLSDETDLPYLGAIKNKPVAVGGRIIAPSSDESLRWQIHFELSDDNGLSWNYITVPSSGTIASIQPSILIHPDGSLQALSRTKNGFLSSTWSHDNGLSWQPERLTDIPNNNSGIDCLTLSSGLFAMVYNPVGKAHEAEFGARTPLTLALSDDGCHWTDVLDLDHGPGEFSYPAIIEAGGALHIVYTWNRQKIRYVKVLLNPLPGACDASSQDPLRSHPTPKDASYLKNEQTSS